MKTRWWIDRRCSRAWGLGVVRSRPVRLYATDSMPYKVRYDIQLGRTSIVAYRYTDEQWDKQTERARKTGLS